MPTFNHIRAGGDGPTVGLLREARIRWILFRRAHRVAGWQWLLLAAVSVAVWIGFAAYSAYRSDQALRQQLADLQVQTQGLATQVRAEREEVAVASSPAWQTELARADGLISPGQRVYVVESPATAAGPTPAEQGAAVVGQSVLAFSRGVLATI